MTLHASRRKWLLIAAGSATFVALGSWLVTAGASVVGWMNIAFFGLCLLTAVWLLLVGGTLTLTQEGMQVRHLGRAWPLLRWTDCSDFRPWHFPAAPALVVFAYTGRRLPWQPGMATRGTRTLTGSNAALPDTYGLAAADLADILREAQHRASTT